MTGSQERHVNAKPLAASAQMASALVASKWADFLFLYMGRMGHGCGVPKAASCETSIRIRPALVQN